MKKRQLILFFTLGILLMTACTPTVEREVDEGPKKNLNKAPKPVKEEVVEETNETEYPLFLTTMTHMEGNWDFVLESEDAFNRQIDKLDFAMNLADEYGVTLTIESEQPFAEANVKWDRNFMKEIIDRGHQVGSHCDRGGPRKISLKELTEELTLVKELVDGLVGAENNQGCSGAGASADWAQAMLNAGFSYVNGVVGFHMQAFPMDARPEGWTDQAIVSAHYHDNVPIDLAERIHLFRLKNTLDWTPDETGIVVSSGEMGRLAFLDEGDRNKCIKSSNCELSTEDVDTAIELILEASKLHDKSRIAKMAFYFPTEDFEATNESVLRYFFEETKKLEEEGVIKWAGQLEVYEAFLEWENNQK